MMGGIPTDINGHVLVNETAGILPGLFAVGECACVSVHGANRLGCNSLIDLVVFGRRTGISVSELAKEKTLSPLPQQAENIVIDKINSLLGSLGHEHVPILRGEMQCLMTQKCSVFRNNEELKEALQSIRHLQKRFLNVGLAYKDKVFNLELQETLELSNMLTVAEVIVFSALQRKESRGAHFRSDYPERKDDEGLRHSLVYLTPQGLKTIYKPVSITRFTPEKRSY
jgi:succinate dehydrogenase / fumarate reductase flavoprotein subunit